MQTKAQSIIEVLAGTAFGFGIALLAQVLITRHYGIIRGYAVRRFFNWFWSK